ncbi:BspA family leucine-rich repeat surface protein [Mycoplasma capricolum subsp. capripneumoniae]|uniref:BspA family leucine-rich repeat surface protein n=1 Tax=Mycoplasma capricolum TaxID=2095 RepID=UPI0004E7F6BF|nr:BspA family leucine-rich repeat surface protein [Mycoplasma capricolum]QIN42971.1 BspA family leucine-rich repeat surface protein [Mycoplasma capricolum subsp. capripneumoniae]QIN46400.1 BspA family leucine-rich repeat surface protein [Mycoplasma capricolum subsp. capripneumoniae]QIN47089.1 BspA family leucine-rich repeat surface protein [Mycoplasma capricolum subsp. capripneumoniae]QIN48464.1 BspA family leucine-rich repeat surface protein [Mycoplasma capricolum subsp. capripneumoniae]QIN4
MFENWVIIQDQIYNVDQTECLQIGYFLDKKTNKVQIIEFLSTTKKVPKVLPKEITSISFAFIGNKNEFIDGIQYWDTSNVTDMNHMFYWCADFNQDISSWNTSNVKNMQSMFSWASLFNQNISNWDTSNVLNMKNMFYTAEKFNQDLSTWDVSNVKREYQNIGFVNPNWNPEHRPKFNKVIS